jgi:hypothetical protein
MSVLLDAMSVASSDWRYTDWLEVVLSDFDLVTDVLFAVSVRRTLDACRADAEGCADERALYTASSWRASRSSPCRWPLE